MRVVLLLVGLIVAAVASAEVYRWVDENGNVNYSDRPHEGAETVTLPSAQTFKAPISNRRRPATGDAKAQTVDAQAGAGYELVEIVSPTQEEVLWNSGGKVNVAVRVAPELQSGHSLALFLDGKRVDVPTNDTTQITLTEVFRGEHQLRAEVHGASGIKLMESRLVSFTVQQTSQFNPNNPNAGTP